MIGVLVRKARAALDVVVAVTAVARARRAVARRPVGALVGKSDPQQILAVPRALAAADRQRGERWGAAVDRALRWLPGDEACLVRASALRDLVVARGLPGATVRIGVRRDTHGFLAHAWVEKDGIPIAEPDSLRGAFSSLDGVTLR